MFTRTMTVPVVDPVFGPTHCIISKPLDDSTKARRLRRARFLAGTSACKSNRTCSGALCACAAKRVTVIQ